MFWQRHPALFFGLFVYLGALEAFQPSFYPLIPIVFLCYKISWKKALFAFLTLLSAYFYTHHTVRYPPVDCDEITGTALVEITDISQKVRYGAPCLKLQLNIVQLDSVKNVPCSMSLKELEALPECGFRYEVPGTLKRIQDTMYVFSPKKGARWQQKKAIFSLAELRLKAKMATKKFLRAYLPPGLSRAFLEGLVIGEFNDPILAQNLRRFGLSHIMVVSGFHFSLIVACFAFVVRFFFSWKISIISLLIATTGYLLFLGPTPSVLRAFISVAVLFLGKLLERNANGLNSLGIALAVLIIFEPTFCLHLGFQLSFLATGAILLFYPQFDAWLSKIFPTRSSSQVLAMSRFDQIGYLFLVFFRKSYALGFAVNALMVPMCLYCFQSYPLMALIYNSFFPFLVGILLFLLFTAALFSPLPLFGAALFSLCHSLTEMTLTFVSFAPSSFDKVITVGNPSLFLLLLYLSGITFLGIYLLEKRQRDAEVDLFLKYL